MDNKTKQAAEEQHRHYGDWLENYGKASEVAPTVKALFEITKWQVEACSSAPDAIKAVPSQHLYALYERNLDLSKRVLPPLPTYEPQAMNSLVSTSTTAGSATYGVIVQSGTIPNPEARAWSTEFRVRYEDLQKKHKSRETVRDLLCQLSPKIADEFDEANRICDLVGTGTQSREAAGIAMRNVLGHYKGELVARATKRSLHKREHWPVIADKLLKGTKYSGDHQTLLDQGKKWDELQVKLSGVAKSEARAASIDLTALHTELIDHLLAVLTLVKI